MVIWSFSTMHSAFLIQNDWIPRSVCDASWIAWRHASSKLFGDWAITSMLRTIDIVVSSGGPWPQLPPVVPIPYAVFGASRPGPAQWAVRHRARDLVLCTPQLYVQSRSQSAQSSAAIPNGQLWHPLPVRESRQDANTPYNGGPNLRLPYSS